MKNTKERIYLTKDNLEAQRGEARYWRHIERYISVRSEVYGNVLDLACGVGYGSHLLAMNPDVDCVIGCDIDEEAIEFANKEYASDKVLFCSDVKQKDLKIDVLVSIETIEHIKDINILPQMARDLQIPKLIISFPHIKSTHFNSYHFHDFNTQQIKDLFPEWVLIDENKIHHDVTILQFVANPKSWKTTINDTDL